MSGFESCQSASIGIAHDEDDACKLRKRSPTPSLHDIPEEDKMDSASFEGSDKPKSNKSDIHVSRQDSLFSFENVLLNSGDRGDSSVTHASEEHALSNTNASQTEEVIRERDINVEVEIKSAADKWGMLSVDEHL